MSAQGKGQEPTPLLWEEGGTRHFGQQRDGFQTDCGTLTSKERCLFCFKGGCK